MPKVGMMPEPGRGLGLVDGLGALGNVPRSCDLVEGAPAVRARHEPITTIILVIVAAVAVSAPEGSEVAAALEEVVVESRSLIRPSSAARTPQ